MRYETGELLGQGGMGEVYRAFDAQLQRPVALKFLRREDPRQIERLLREARAQAKVEHPGICRVYEVGEHEGRHFIAMQLVEGEPLDKLAPRLSIEQRVLLLRDVALAVHAAHRVGLVHRDLKPQNVLVESREGQLLAFVTDFGIVRDAEAKSLTRTGEALGTPPYMSPEQARGELQSIDRRSDVWSLGAVLFELVAGRPPFDGGGAVQTLFQIINTDAPALRKLSPRAPRDLEVIAARCLEKEPQRRYPSARALADELTRWLDGEPIEARPPGVARRLWARARRNRAALLVGGAALVAMALVLALWLRAVLGAREQARLAQQLSRDAESIESTLRIAHLLPLHDVRPERARVRERMRSLEARLASLGAAAEGPGHHALGRGALALHDLAGARGHLEKAWAAGYHAPEVALALGQALGEQYRAALDEAQGTESESARAERRKAAEGELRDPALAWLRSGRGAAVETPVLIEALIALYEGRSEDALAQAQAAQRDAPSLYEAARLEGDAWTRMASDRRERGELDAALGFAEKAAGPYLKALEMGRSDELTELAECGRRYQVVTILAERGRPVEQDAAAALAACDRALVIDPDSARAFTQKAEIDWRLGMQQVIGGTDPSPTFVRSTEMAREAIRRDPQSQLAWVNLGAAWFLLGDKWERRHGIDPRPSLARAVESYQRAIALRPTSKALANLCSAHTIVGDYEKTHGGDPRPHWERAVESCRRSSALDPRFAHPYNTLGVLFAGRAEWEIGQGLDPRASVKSGSEALRKTIELQPSYAFAHVNLGALFSAQAGWERAQGLDCSASVEESVRSSRRAVELMPAYFGSYDNLADTWRTLALSRIDRGLDPAAALGEARGALDAGLKVNAKDHFNYLQRARIELVAARLAPGAPGAPALFDAALSALARSAEIDAKDADVPETEAEVRRWQAEWQLARGRPAGEPIEQGLAAAARALALNPALAEALAARGALLEQRSRAEPSPERKAALAGEAKAALQKARAMNPLLGRDYPP